MDRVAESGLDPDAPIRAYGLAVLGTWLGLVSREEVQARRPAAAALQGDENHAELAWLDGIIAVTGRDRSALAQARARVRESGGPDAPALDHSLAAFDQALAGDSLGAGKALAQLEWDEAKTMAPHFAQHPYAIAIHRVAAARWLLAAGDFDQAARLLTFVEGAYGLHPSQEVNIMLAGLVYRDRARIEERRGRAALAREYEIESRRRLSP
jgi:hypothetical protein